VDETLPADPVAPTDQNGLATVSSDDVETTEPTENNDSVTETTIAKSTTRTLASTRPPTTVTSTEVNCTLVNIAEDGNTTSLDNQACQIELTLSNLQGMPALEYTEGFQVPGGKYMSLANIAGTLSKYILKL
jgi:hypothetical protein